MTPPDWWRDVILDARANRRDNIYGGNPHAEVYRWANVGSVHCPIDAHVEMHGESIVYRHEKDLVAVPEELLKRSDSGALSCDLSGRFTKQYCFLAAHDDAGYPHDLGCIDRPTGKLVWKSTVCGCFCGLTSGLHQSWASVVSTDDGRVFVFGAASTGFYMHGFRAPDGKSLVHFSNNY